MILRCTLALLLFTTAAQAQPEQFLGYPIGHRFTPHHQILAYFDALAKGSPLVTVQKIGETYEGRPLVLAVIASAKNRAALEMIRRNASALANAEVDAARAAELVKSVPAVVWLAFGVHGNESSSAEASMLVAHALVREPALLENVVVIIDPLSNPDGRERYISGFHRQRGEKANANPDAFEHFEPWPGGRTNHYLIDMNRDWAWASQRETQARIAAYSEWNPQVYVDFHEMSAQSSYFFPPDAKPINANLPAEVEKWLEVFGRANAEEFSRRGWAFFVGERFDLFYPGYGDSWPALHGAIGMTYEMAGSGRAGSVIEREDGAILTLADRAQRHFTTGMTTVRTAAANAPALLRYTYDAARAQIEAGKNTFLLVPGSPNFDALIGKLEQQNIRMEMLTAPVTLRASRVDREAVETHAFNAGTVVVNTRQPLGGLANTLLERSAALGKGFVDEQREKAVADEPDDFYDLTTWSLPLAMNVEAYVTTAPVTGTTPYRKPAPATFRAAAYGYLVDGLDPALYRLAGRLLSEKIRFSVSDDVVFAGIVTHARGSLVILEGNNAPTLEATLAKLVTDTGATLIPLDSGWTGGTAFGSERMRHVKDPKIGLVGGPGVSSNSFGMLWHTLDVDTPIPHTTLQLESLRNIGLHRYEVLIFPDGSYSDRIGKSGLEKLKTWVNDGGTLIAVKGANEYLRGKDVELSKLKPWEPPKKKDDEKPADERYNDFRIPGSAFRTSMNARSYLTFGVPRAPAVLIEGTEAWLPVAHKVDNIVTVDAKDPLISGVAWPESLERVKGSVYVVAETVGKGRVISFADDPHFRLFWRGTLPIFLNAVLYSPSF